MLKGFIAGIAVANAFEWVAHKYILHGVHRAGKPRYSPVPRSMESHWAHHREVRKQQFHDDCYVEGVGNWRTKNELISLAVVATVSSAIFFTRFQKVWLSQLGTVLVIIIIFIAVHI